MAIEVSFVIPSHNEGENLRKTVHSLQNATQGSYEIIVVDNGSTDGSSDFIEQQDTDCLRLVKNSERLGVSGARNLGAGLARGAQLVFLDAHILFPPGWLRPLLDALAQEEVGIAAPGVSAWGNAGAKGYGMRWRNTRLDVEWLGRRSAAPYPVPMLPGLCLAFRTDFFRQIGAFDPGMLSYGSEDLEICLRTWLLGCQVVIVPGVEISHLFRHRHPYAVNWSEVLYNSLRTVYAHFNEARAGRVVAAMRSYPAFGEAFERVQGSDIWERKRCLEQERRYDDDWFFGRFGPAL